MIASLRIFALAAATAALAGPAGAAPQTGAPRTTRPVLEMVFAIDTTGSMGGLIDAARQKVWSIVNDVLKSPSHPAVRVGLVAFRDHGDTYVTKVLPLTSDLDHVYTTLMQYTADGGGDTPEDVRRALEVAVANGGWSPPTANAARILFLVGDSPPHDDYQNEPDVLASAGAAVRAGIAVNAVQCGSSEETKRAWESIARRGEGEYFAIAQDGGVQSVSTRYDGRLSELGRKLGGTMMAYGGGGGRAGVELRAGIAGRAMAAESAIAASAPAPAQADRAINKAINPDAYAGDLLQSIENGSVRLKDVPAASLPERLQRAAPAERPRIVQLQLAERRAMRAEILRLSRLRDGEIASHSAKQAAKAGRTSFDEAVRQALRRQAARKGIRLRG